VAKANIRGEITLPRGIQTSAVVLLDRHRDPVMDQLDRMNMQSPDTIIERMVLYHHCERISLLLREA
jgi:hypothetical protein